ncbi:MAG: DUF1501 domain-containing protein [Planctomycetes bacterium]|nr:DUF1501 domain-containing protein [Planctomycetota bacterium]
MRTKRLFDSSDDFSRRAFVSGAARGLLGLTTVPLLSGLGLRAATGAVAGATGGGTARSVIYLYMSGGMSHLDTFDPKPGAATQGPTESIRTAADDVLVSSNLPNLARHMDKICLFRGMQSTQGAHAQARYFLHTSYELRGTIKHPTMGTWLDYMRERQNPALPGHVEIGGQQYTAAAGFLESVHGPLPIGDPDAGLQNSRRPNGVSEDVAARRLARLERMNHEFADRFDHKGIRAYADMYDQALRLMQSSELAAFDLTAEPESIREAYGDDDFGQGCLLARRLVEHGVGYVEVVNGGWDSHNQNFDVMDDKLPPLDRSIAALLSDLESRGLLDETLVVLATEFGRTPQIVASNNGRNHFPKAFTCWMAGGGVRGGRTFGGTNDDGSDVVEGATTIPDFNATIAHALGLPLEQVVTSPSKRPFTVAHKGTPVTQVFA